MKNPEAVNYELGYMRALRGDTYEDDSIYPEFAEGYYDAKGDLELAEATGDSSHVLDIPF